VGPWQIGDCYNCVGNCHINACFQDVRVYDSFCFPNEIMNLCEEAPPAPGFVCYNGVMEVSGDQQMVSLVLQNGNFTVLGNMVIKQDLVLQNSDWQMYDLLLRSGSTITLNNSRGSVDSLVLNPFTSVDITAGTNSYIDIQNCANFSGNLIIQHQYTSDLSSETYFTYACHNGQFSSINVVGGDSCHSMEGIPSYNEYTFVVSFKISSVNCGGLPEGTIIGIAVGGACALLVLVLVIVAVSCKAVRRKVFPFRHRRHHHFEERNMEI